MQAFLLQQVRDWQGNPVENGKFFNKHKMSKNTAVVYLTEQAANMALAQLYSAERWAVVSIEIPGPQNEGKNIAL